MLVSFEYEDFVSRINACADGNSEYSSKQTGLSCLCRSLWRKYRSHLNMNRSLLRACFVPWVKMLQVCQGMYGIIHSHVCYYSCMHMCDVTYLYVWHDSFLCMAWHIHMYDMAHSHWWNDSFIWVSRPFVCVSWRIHVRAMIHWLRRWLNSKTWKDDLRCMLLLSRFESWHTTLNESWHTHESWYTHEWFIPFMWMGHGTHVNDLCPMYGWVTSHISMRHIYVCDPCHSYVSHVTHEEVMWLIWMSSVNESSHTWRSHMTHMNESCQWVMSM